MRRIWATPGLTCHSTSFGGFSSLISDTTFSMWWTSRILMIKLSTEPDRGTLWPRIWTEELALDKPSMIFKPHYLHSTNRKSGWKRLRKRKRQLFPWYVTKKPKHFVGMDVLQAAKSEISARNLWFPHRSLWPVEGLHKIIVGATIIIEVTNISTCVGALHYQHYFMQTWHGPPADLWYLNSVFWEGAQDIRFSKIF